MKLIEGLKAVSRFRTQQDELIAKIQANSILLKGISPEYGEDQAKTVAGWLEDVRQVGAEIISLSIRIQKTNHVTHVTIEIGGLEVKMTISEWILRRRVTRLAEMRAWAACGALTAGKIAEGADVTRYFKPAERDAKVNLLLEETTLIDSALDIANATTDLVPDEV
jgi:hypothetical protein